MVGLLDMVKVLSFALSEGKVAVHCHAGLGRTGKKKKIPWGRGLFLQRPHPLFKQKYDCDIFAVFFTFMQFIFRKPLNFLVILVSSVSI